MPKILSKKNVNSQKNIEDLYVLLEDIQNELVKVQTKTMPPIQIRIKEAAQILGQSVSYLYDLVALGNIPHYKDGRIYFKYEELVEWSFDKDKKQLVNN